MSSDSAKALDRVRKLLALATGTSFEQEARSAALQAAMLIKEHKLVVDIGGGSTDTKHTYSQPPWTHPPPPRPPPSPKSVGRRSIFARYGGRCHVCRDRFEAGDTIWWWRDEHGRSFAAHDECGDDIDA